MRTVSEIDAEIAKVTAELETVHGRPAEVYTRIVGYYRSVRNWNKGKRDEYDQRVLFKADENKVAAANNCAKNCIEKTKTATFNFGKEQIARVELYTRERCPNCPPVIEFCHSVAVTTNEYDVDSREGFQHAHEKAVRSAPTVICYDADGVELTRAYSVNDLKKIF